MEALHHTLAPWNIDSGANRDEFQVLRWSALGLGVFYGIYHQASISSREKLNKINREYKHKEELINKAKAEWAKKTMPAESKMASGGRMSPSQFRKNRCSCLSFEALQPSASNLK